MTTEQRTLIVEAALKRLFMSSHEVLAQVAPWLRHQHVLWCLHHWQDRPPEDEAAMAVIREAAVLMRSGEVGPGTGGGGDGYRGTGEATQNR